MTPRFASPHVRLVALLWLLSMVGTALVTVEDLPRLLAGHAVPIPMWLLISVSLTQSATFVAVAAWAGAALSPAVDLHAPAFEALASGRPLVPALAPQILPGFVAGALAGAALVVIGRYTPTALAGAQERFSPSLLGRVFYGGVTEEVLMRWGVMTTLLWLVWRFVYRRTRVPGAITVSLVVATSSLLFGLGHLPSVVAFTGRLSADVALFVVAGNAGFGILF